MLFQIRSTKTHQNERTVCNSIAIAKTACDKTPHSNETKIRTHIGAKRDKKKQRNNNETIS